MQSDPGSAWVLLPRAEQKQMPWRNGMGSTREIAIDPPDGTVAGAFRWRVSSAPVMSHGPFSQFAGVDRSLWLLEGAGLELTIDGASTLLTQALDRVDFAGESLVSAKLIQGPILDLNVMANRTYVRAHSAIVRDSGHTLVGGCDAVIVAIHAAVVATEPRAGSAAGDQGPWTLQPGDALRRSIRAGHAQHVTVTGTVLCAQFVDLRG